MKKKHVWIPIVIAAVLFYGICLTGYTLLSKRLERIQIQGFIEDSYKFLSEDQQFLSKYGEIKSFDTDDKKPIDIKNDKGKTEYYMDFKCHTETMELLIRVYQAYDNGWTFYYTIIDAQ